jgi:hypothetical protein
MERDSDLRRRAAAGCLIAAPLALTAGDLLSVQDVLSHFARHSYAGLVVHLAAAVLLFGATLGLVHLLRPEPVYALVTSAAAAFGFMGETNILAVRLHSWALETAVGSERYGEMGRAMAGEIEAAFVPVIFVPSLFVPIALLLAGIGLWRWTRLPRWSLALLILGTLLYAAGRLSVSLSLILLSDSLLVISMTFVGIHLLRQAGAFREPAQREGERFS